MDGSKCPLTTPKVSSTAFKIGVIFVVQDAAEKILIFIGIVFVVVYAMYNI
jgi:hypothetical protein